MNLCQVYGIINLGVHGMQRCSNPLQRLEVTLETVLQASGFLLDNVSKQTKFEVSKYLLKVM